VSAAPRPAKICWRARVLHKTFCLITSVNMAPVRTFKNSNPKSHLNIILTKTANSVLSHFVHGTQQVFLFFRNITRFHGTPVPVLSRTLWKITAFLELIFTEFKNIQHYYVQYISLTPNFSKIEENLRSTDSNSFTLCGFKCAHFRDTRKSEALQTAPVPNFTEIGQKYGPYSKI